jgi:hypothetical protein
LNLTTERKSLAGREEVVLDVFAFLSVSAIDSPKSASGFADPRRWEFQRPREPEKSRNSFETTVKLDYNELSGTINIVCYNREALCTKVIFWDRLIQNFKFVMAAIVLTEFD